MATAKETVRAVVIIILAFGGLLILFYYGDNPSSVLPVEQGVVDIGKPLPDFSLSDLTGRAVRLADQRGRVVLVNIWATWCPPCVEEMPSMEALYDKLPKGSFEILAVSIDAQGKGAVEPFMKKHKLTFPALIDPAGAIAVAYGATGVPESFIVDQNGILVRKVIGPIHWDSPAVIDYFNEMIQPAAAPTS